MPILKVTVWDKSEHKKRKLVCGSDIASLSESRKAMSAVVGRFDTLDKIEGNPSFIVLDVARATPVRDYSLNDWNSRKNLSKDA